MNTNVSQWDVTTIVEMCVEKHSFFCVALERVISKYQRPLYRRRKAYKHAYIKTLSILLTRNKSILLLFSPVFLSGSSYFSYLLCSRFCSKLSYIRSYILNSDIIHVHILYLKFIYKSQTAIAKLIISQLYSFIMILNATFNKTKCADCSIRAHQSFSI